MNSEKELCTVLFILMLTPSCERKYIYYLPFVKKHIKHVMHTGSNGLLLAVEIILILMIYVFKAAGML